MPVFAVCVVVFVPGQYAIFFFYCVFVSSGTVGTCSVVESVYCIPPHTHTHTELGGEPRYLWCRCPSLTRSVQDFLQDVATKPVPDFSVSCFLLPSPSASSSSLCLWSTRQRDTGRGREREREKSASNLTTPWLSSSGS